MGEKEQAKNTKTKRYGPLAPRTSLYVSESTAKSMRGNKSTNTLLELTFRRALWQAGVRGYRLHSKLGSITPDIYFPRHRLAVFVHGCFWHGCPGCKKQNALKRNADYWNSKIDQNAARDADQSEELKQRGIRVVTIWECQVRTDVGRAVKTVLDEIEAEPL